MQESHVLRHTSRNTVCGVSMISRKTAKHIGPSWIDLVEELVLEFEKMYKSGLHMTCR